MSNNSPPQMVAMEGIKGRISNNIHKRFYNPIQNAEHEISDLKSLEAKKCLKQVEALLEKDFKNIGMRSVAPCKNGSTVDNNYQLSVVMTVDLKAKDLVDAMAELEKLKERKAADLRALREWEMDALFGIASGEKLPAIPESLRGI